MLNLLLFLSATQALVPNSVSEAQPWPSIKPGRILSTPDWSDYRIYPKAALAKEQEGVVVPDLLVGIDGKPLACRIRVSSNFPELDAGSCDLVMQMRFEPARDVSGLPILSRYSAKLNWGLTDPRPFASSTLVAHVAIRDGRMRDCKIVGGNGPYVIYWTSIACAVFSDVGYFFGQHSRESLEAIIEVTLDAGDQNPTTTGLRRAGEVIAIERLQFTINGKGDASNCRPLESRGFGPRSLNNLSPCGRLLSGLWFEDALPNTPPRRGTIETRVLAAASPSP